MDTESIDQLLKFLPRFAAGDFATASEQYQSTGRYMEPVNDLIQAIGSSGLLLQFDWTAWKDGALYARDPSLLKTADLETVRRVLTTIVRQDRFVGGLMPRVCSNGTMKELLERLAELYDHR